MDGHNYACLMIYMYVATCYILIFFITGNFGVVYKAYYTREGVQTKVAIKTLKGDYQ